MEHFPIVVVMGNEDTDFTSEYLNSGDYPAFRIYSSSINKMYDARLSDGPYPFSDLSTHVVSRIEVEIDCCGELGGHSQIDYCGDCVMVWHK